MQDSEQTGVGHSIIILLLCGWYCVHIVELCCGGQTVMSRCEGVEDIEIFLRTTVESFVFINHVLPQGIITEHSLLIASFNKHC